MPADFQAPVLLITALLLPAFGYLYIRLRDARTLLWLIGYILAFFSEGFLYACNRAGGSSAAGIWLTAAGQTCALVSAALFLGSLSPRRFHLRNRPVLYAVPYASLLVIESMLFFGISRGVDPTGFLSLVCPLLASIALVAALLWSGLGRILPATLAVLVFVLLGGMGYTVSLLAGPGTTLSLFASANLLIAALLLVLNYERFSPGVVLSFLGLAAWSLSSIPVLSFGEPQWSSFLSIGKVIAATGMLVLTLEDEIRNNRMARDREHRVRRQLEAYAGLILTRRRVEDFDRQGNDICNVVVKNSCFSQAALFFESGGRYRLAGTAGLEGAIARALEDLAGRLPVESFLAPGSVPSAVGNSKTVELDLSPWLLPGDDLERLCFTSAFAIPMMGRTGADGALLLRGMRSEGDGGSGADAPRLDDLLPIETLVDRLQAARGQTMLFEKLIDSERFACLGQLAGNVTQQLNSPLTVILGYASLLSDSSSTNAQDRNAAQSIVAEARRIRSTLETLSRVSLAHTDPASAITVPELLADIEKLYKQEFLHRCIDFQVNVAPGLPKVLCGAPQLRQALMHCLQYATDAVEHESPSTPRNFSDSRIVRVDAGREGNSVQISVSHSGAGFLHPERAFDPFVSSRTGGGTAGMGLSMCATILRDQNGRASAVNLKPRGAAIVLELETT